MGYNNTVYSKEMKKIKRLATKRRTPFHDISVNGKAVCFLYQVGSKVKGYSYANMRQAVPAELKRLSL